MRKLLSLDLGITTGYAVIWANGELHESGNLNSGFMVTSLAEWITILQPSRSVAELPVIVRGKLGDELQTVVDATKKALTRQVDLVDPAEWKQTPWKKHPLPRGLSTHERDAIRLGLWYLNDRLKGL